MDNLCHTLAGLAIGEAGLKRRTSLGNATLMIGANLPDIDVLSYAWGSVNALGFRRGWTHGILAMGLWPFLLAGTMYAIGMLRHRLRPPVPLSPRPPSFSGLLLLATVSVWSHPLLDLLNTYGVRLLMPFSGRWFYGDTLFIIDAWVWLALGIGIVWARLQERGSRSEERGGWPARVAIAGVLLYIGLMATSAARMRARVMAEMGAHEPRPVRAMVAPVPLNPFRRQVVVELPDAYATGVMHLPSGRFEGQWVSIPKHEGRPASRAAAATPDGRTFLGWARFPFFDEGDDCGPGLVCIRDARYFPMTWAEVAVGVGRTISLVPTPPSGIQP